jgi:hypothetical protein
MNKNIFKNINNDERIKNMIYKFGFESFLVISVLLSIIVIIKNTYIIENSLSYRTEFFVLSIGVLYFLIRSAFSGMISLPEKKKDRKSFIKYLSLSNIIFGFSFGTYIAIRNSILYLEGNFNWLSISILFITAFSAMILGFSIMGVFLVISNYKAKKELN